MIRALNLQENASLGRAHLALAPGAGTRARASVSPSNQRRDQGPDGGVSGAAGVGMSVTLPGQGLGLGREGVGATIEESTSLMSADILGLGEDGRGVGGSKVVFAQGQGLDESKGEGPSAAGADKPPPVTGGKGAGERGLGVDHYNDDDDDWDPNSSLEQLSKSLLLGGAEVQTSSKADKGQPGALAQPSLTGYLIREEGSVSFRPATKVSQRQRPPSSCCLNIYTPSPSPNPFHATYPLWIIQP